MYKPVILFSIWLIHNSLRAENGEEWLKAVGSAPLFGCIRQDL